MFKGGIVLAASILGVVVVGCSSSSSSSDPFGSSPDFGSIQQQFKAPSGTFAGHEAKAFSAYATQQNNGNAVSGFSFAGGTSSAAYGKWRLQSLGIHPQDTGAFCAIGQSGGATSSCACPGGGDIQWDLSGLQQYSQAAQNGGPIDATIKIAANACKSADGSESLDGKIFENFRGTIPAAGATAAPTDFAIIMDAHFTSVTAGTTEKVDIDLEYAMQNGSYSAVYSVQVDDGNVVVSGNWDSTSKTGTVTVTDKTGTVTCVANDGKTAVCTSSTGKSTTVTL